MAKDKGKIFKIINLSNQKIIAKNAKVAENTWQRTKGLLGRVGLEEGEALIIPFSGSIHTLFMRFNIDLIFLGRKQNVLKTAQNVPPWRIVRAPFWAMSVIELPTNTINLTNTQIGHKVVIEAVQSGQN